MATFSVNLLMSLLVIARSVRTHHRIAGLGAHRSWVGAGSSGRPQWGGSLADVVVAGEAPAEAAVHAGCHALGERAVAHHLQEEGGGVAVVEPVTLEAPLEVASVAEPRAADAAHLVPAAVGARGSRDLAPQADHLALPVVDQDLLVGVLPAVEA